MSSIGRRQQIIAYLHKKHEVTVAELSKMFYVSETTIRRDLDKLDRLGFIEKIYGGAVLIQGENSVLPLTSRERQFWEEKTIIAQTAADLVNHGDVVFLDSSSTALAMAPFLARRSNVTVITNSIKTSAVLTEFADIKVYCSGGRIVPNTYSCNGSYTCKMLLSIHANLCFISPKAVHLTSGVFCSDEEEGELRRVMIKQSDRSVLLCNTAKLHQYANFYLCGLDQIDTIICEKKPNESWLNCFAQNNIHFIEAGT